MLIKTTFVSIVIVRLAKTFRNFLEIFQLFSKNLMEKLNFYKISKILQIFEYPKKPLRFFTTIKINNSINKNQHMSVYFLI